jgi:hypothetical protein
MSQPFDLDGWLKAEIQDYVDVPPNSDTLDVIEARWADFGRKINERITSLDLVKAITTALLSYECDPEKKTLQVHVAERVRIYLFTGVIK